MMNDLTIRNGAEHARALARLRAVMGRTDFSPDELADYRSMAKAVHDYEQRHSPVWQVKTDGADELEFQLDQGRTTLDELARIFGTLDLLIEYMTRCRDIDAATKDTLACKLNIDRDFLDEPFASPPGWQDIDLQDDNVPWRAELIAHRDAKARTNRDAQDRQDDAATREPELAAAL